MEESIYNPSLPYKSPYIRSSYSILPHTRERFRSTKIPFFLAVTPFPNGIDQSKTTLLKFPCNKVMRCPYCTAYTTSNSKNNSKCEICGFKMNKTQRIITEEQYREQNFDMLFPRSEQDIESQEIQPVNYENYIISIIIELSATTKQNNVFDSVLDEIKKIAKEKKHGFVSIFAFNNGLYVPKIERDQNSRKCSISKIIDPGDSVFYSPEKMLFKINKDMELLTLYIEELKNIAPTTVSTTILDIMKSVDTISRDQSFTPFLIFSEAETGDREGIIAQADKTMNFNNAIDFFAIEPQTKNQNISALFEYTQRMGSKLNIYSQNELDLPNIICNDIRRRTETHHFFGSVFFVIVPESLKIVDIHGTGIRSCDNVFRLNSLYPGSTVYIELEYNSRYLPEQLEIQVQVMFRDSSSRKFIRVLTQSFSTSSDYVSVFNRIDFDVFTAGAITRGISLGRMGGEEIRKEMLKKELESITNNKNTLRNIERQHRNKKNRVLMALRLSQSIVDDKIAAKLFGKSPEEITSFFAPIATPISIDGLSYEQIMLVDMQMTTGAFFVKGGDGKSFVFVDGNQNFQNWVQALTEDSQPARNKVAELSQGDYTQIISPTQTPNHPLVKYTYRLINALN